MAIVAAVASKGSGQTIPQLTSRRANPFPLNLLVATMTTEGTSLISSVFLLLLLPPTCLRFAPFNGAAWLLTHNYCPARRQPCEDVTTPPAFPACNDSTPRKPVGGDARPLAGQMSDGDLHAAEELALSDTITRLKKPDRTSSRMGSKPSPVLPLIRWRASRTRQQTESQS